MSDDDAPPHTYSYTHELFDFLSAHACMHAPDDATLVESAIQLDDNLAGASIIHHFEVANVSALLHAQEKLHHHLARRSEQHLPLAPLLGIRERLQRVCKNADTNLYILTHTSKATVNGNTRTSSAYILCQHTLSLFTRCALSLSLSLSLPLSLSLFASIPLLLSLPYTHTQTPIHTFIYSPLSYDMSLLHRDNTSYIHTHTLSLSLMCVGCTYHRCSPPPPPLRTEQIDA